MNKPALYFWRAAAALALMTAVIGGVSYYLKSKPQIAPPPPPPPPANVAPVLSAAEEADQAYEAANRAFARQQFEAAIKQYSRAVELDPAFVAAYVARGNAHLSLMRYDRAMSDYNLAISQDPKYVSAYFSRGTVHWLLGELRESERDYRKAVELEPDDKLLYEKLASVLYEQKHGGEVEMLYQNAYLFDPSREWALTGWLGEVLNEKRYADVLATCRRLREKGNDSTALSLYAGLAHAGLKEYGEAIPELEEVVGADPDGLAFNAYATLAEAYRARGSVGDCERNLKEFSRREGREVNLSWCAEVGTP